jgi:hypothetical protein
MKYTHSKEDESIRLSKNKDGAEGDSAMSFTMVRLLCISLKSQKLAVF